MQNKKFNLNQKFTTGKEKDFKKIAENIDRILKKKK